MTFSFPDAVYTTIGLGVPCYRPFTGIKLLQLIFNDDIRPRESVLRHWMRRSLRCIKWGPESQLLYNAGSNLETLMTLMDDAKVRNELQGIVDDAQNVKVLTAEDFASVKMGLLAPFIVDDKHLARFGLKGMSDDGWKLAFGNGQVTKRAVPPLTLTRFIEKHSAAMENILHDSTVVTAIYFIRGRLQLKAHTKDVAFADAKFPCTDTPIRIGVGWHFTVTETGDVVMADDNPREWIIAIECLKVESVLPRRSKRNSWFPRACYSDSPNVRSA